MLKRSNPVKIMFVASICLLFGSFGFAQGKVDLEIKVQSASDTARGGETFSYTISVSNIGSATASKVMLWQVSRTKVISAVSSAGTCEEVKDSSQIPVPFRCLPGDLKAGETVVINFEVKIDDFGNEADFKNSGVINSAPLKDMAESMSRLGIDTQPNPNGTSIADVDVSAAEDEENSENNRTEIFVNLLPSKNIAPRIEIVSPKDEAVFVKPLNKQIEVSIVVKASDADGKIVKVLVSDMNNPELRFIVEDNQYKYSIGGKTYTKKELEEAYKDENFLKLLDVRANLTGKDTYTYVAKKFTYGRNRILISAVDDGGRESSQSVEFTINRDATVELVSPKSGQIFTPNSTITIETISKINDSVASQLRINGTVNEYFYPDFASIPLLQQVSKTGNTYKHQYVWKNMREGVYSLNVMLFDGETPSLLAETVRVIVAEPRIIKIYSIKNNQEFKEGETIKVSAGAVDIKDKVVFDELEFIVDGKSEGTISNSWSTESVPPYKKFFEEQVGRNLINLKKGTHTIQIVARQSRYSQENAPILGKSEIITIKVK